MSSRKPSKDLIRLLPRAQYLLMKETPDIFEEEVKRMNKIAKRIPKLYETDGVSRHPLSLHYFVGGCDWYIAEWDREEDLFFGYAILNGDYEMSEWGYISLPEILSLEIPERHLMINLDLHCHEQFIEDALYTRNPKHFWKYRPGSGVEEET
ncbi:hypothetical protein FACS1894142_4980 [Spirochaetia bacterium]|nr:hypothetical protein FACS1894142_4980 [Spirochaetia bacterium]